MQIYSRFMVLTFLILSEACILLQSFLCEPGFTVIFQSDGVVALDQRSAEHVLLTVGHGVHDAVVLSVHHIVQRQI